MKVAEAGPGHRNGRRTGVAPGGSPSDFDIRRLIREHIRDSDRSSDPGTIAASVVDDIPEEQLRAVIARWLPLQVANEMFNMHAERAGGLSRVRDRV
jgi:hypothetical protein